MNKDNLTLLADYLEANIQDKDFDMRLFSDGDHSEKAPEGICGTVACALGWAPMVIPPVEDDYDGDAMFDYHTYAERVFNLTGEQFHWCFNGSWVEYQQTAKEAVERIRHLVSTGEVGEIPWEYY
jgi:hypothetical protein